MALVDPEHPALVDSKNQQADMVPPSKEASEASAEDLASVAVSVEQVASADSAKPQMPTRA